MFPAKKLPTSTPVPVSASVSLALPEKSGTMPFRNEPCSVMQNLYSAMGSSPMREQAKKPFRTFNAVVLRFALPVWYSIATSNTATTTPVAYSAHASRPNSRTKACTQSKSKISVPRLPICAKNAAAAP